ncbi:MAG: hypothetical protein RL577_1210 [Bacteroidota bacterium]
MNTHALFGTMVSLVFLSQSNPPLVQKSERWIYAKDSTHPQCLDSCLIGNFGEFAFDHLKPGIYDLYRKEDLLAGQALIRQLDMDNPKQLQRHSMLSNVPQPTYYYDRIADYELDDVVELGVSETRKLSRAMPTIESSHSSPYAPSMGTAPIMDAPSGSARVLTAGRWSDLNHWDQFEELHKDASIMAHQSRWGWNLINHRISVELIGKSESYRDISIQLRDNRDSVLFQARTNHLSTAELWTPLAKEAKYKAFAQLADTWIELGAVSLGKNSFRLSQTAPENWPLDIAFIVDATGSMGDEINYLKAELADIIQQSKSLAPCSRVRIGQVFYKDRGDEYVTRIQPFTDRIDDAARFALEQGAGGGGDFPEAVADALEVAIGELDWSPNALARLAFLVLDAPAHDGVDAERVRKATAIAAQKGIRLIPVVASGIDQSTEFLMKYIAAMTAGEYVYITDDSGVGNGHLKPTGVENNSDLLNHQLLAIIREYTQTKACQTPSENPVEPRVEWFGNQQCNIQAYPNPCSDYLQIKSNISLMHVALLNMSGAEVLTSESQQGECRLDVRTLAAGVYNLRAQTEQGSFSTLIVVSHQGQNAKP